MSTLPHPIPSSRPDVEAEVLIPFTVESNYAGWRLDRYLQQKLKRASRNQIQQLIREKLVYDGDRRLKPATPVWTGLHFHLRRPERPEPEGLPETLPVLHEDARVLVVDKPAGLPVHPTARYFAHTVTSLLRVQWPERRPDPVHRLDRETSGVLVCARDTETARALGEAFGPEGQGVHKTYLAILEGAPPWDATVLEAPLALLGEHPVRIRMSVVAPEHPEAKVARTRVTVRQRYRGPDGADFALVACTLDTGRQHQIRAHLHDAGVWVVGDKIYGPDQHAFIRFTEGELSDADRAALRLPRQALHAWRITLPHPDGQTLTVESPLPPDLVGFLDGLERVD